jgi:hypothetical protein
VVPLVNSVELATSLLLEAVAHTIWALLVLTPAIAESTYAFVTPSVDNVGVAKLVIFYEFILTELVGAVIELSVVVAK